ncbi:3-phosphoshikimate 1-carboxyvinyltransferase [Candidatus Pelagibacter ubique]|uniref:3-phosphoshikimate 1-carboxyvinyltransferase n=1 Tax=Pelagibacter ubique TaxID=198252 RepID=A0ABX1T1M4_PELUQ|nr:3-phosphoshikimate 1-carboxyvinyltransferase [Candidatus Pelagibacter ubique]NMN67486.1 3-phosphoshikimate 1-carboxyvinyltransferase [Candidatus Pelagibacter ubique]
MTRYLKIDKEIESFNKKIIIEGDKSLSIRWVLLASQAIGKSKAYNLLMSEDVIAALNSIKKLGIKTKYNKNYCEILGNGINGFKYKKNLTLDASNSGTLGRLLLGLLIKTPKKIKLIGDKSLSKRDFSRVTKPLEKFGAKFDYRIKNKLPLKILGSKSIKSINYLENRGSAQCKSSVMFAALNAPGTTYIKAKKSRDHSELLFKYLKIPIKIKKTKKYDFIEIKQPKKIKPFNYQIPGDISSSAFFMVLATLTKSSMLLIKNVNINPTRLGAVTILKRMGAKILLKKQRNYRGEKISDILIKSSNNLKAINCPSSLNSSAIDEFLVIFLVAAKAKGVSYFKDIAELNQKESPRLIWGSKILNMMGVKTVLTKNSIKIYGQPDLKVTKTIIIKKYLKDHRVFMMSTIAALTCGGQWKIYDKESINTSFPSFLKIINKISNKS